MSFDTNTSTPYRDQFPLTKRFPISPSPGATSAVEQVTILRVQDAGSGFSVQVKNLSKTAIQSFYLAQSNDGGQADAYTNMTMRRGATTTSAPILLQPGGICEVSVDYAFAQKPYVALFTNENNAVGQADFTFNNGSMDRAQKPFAAPIAVGYTQLNSGAVVLNTATFTPVLVYALTSSPTAKRAVSLTGAVAGQALTHLEVEKQTSPSGPWVVVSSDAGLNTADENILFCTNNAYITAAAGSFLMTINMEGCTGIRVSAKCAVNGGTLTLTGSGG